MHRLMLAAALVLALLPGTAQAATGYFPGQFLAKQYTEALGRLPDAPAWQRSEQHFAEQGCHADMITGYSQAIFKSPEFENLGYNRAQRLLALYRGVLNREPDRPGFDHWVTSTHPWPELVDLFVRSEEAYALHSRICSSPAYFWGTAPAITIPVEGAGFTGTEDELQARLNAGGTVELAQSTVVVLTKKLTIPANARLVTRGEPVPREYAKLGRLVRGTFEGQAIDVAGKLEHVWVDGQRNEPGNSRPQRYSVWTLGGTGASVSHNKLSNSAGASNVIALGAFDGYPCRDLSLRGNVITAYSSSNKDGHWTDGLTVTCEDADVSGNQIVDTSDVAIVLFRSCRGVTRPGVPDEPSQNSVARDNTILSAGNPMYGGMGADAAIAEEGQPRQNCAFIDGRITGNTLWTSPNTHFAIGITVGSHAWYGRHPRAHVGTGMTVTNNTVTGRVGTGIAVSGMLEADVTGNELNVTHPGGLTACPDADFAASVSAGTASPKPGTRFPLGYRDVRFDGCIGDPL